MPASAVLLAKRAFVKLLVRLAHAYTIIMSINRDASDPKVLAAFRKVVIKVHPDKGGGVAENSPAKSSNLANENPAVPLRKILDLCVHACI